MVDEKMKVPHLEINVLYMMSLAMDLILRDCEWRMAKNREAWKQEKKQLFTRYMKAVKTAYILQEQLTQDIFDVDASNNWRFIQTWQEESNELARLILLFADRSSDQEPVDRIFKFIREQHGDGVVDDSVLESFYLKK